MKLIKKSTVRVFLLVLACVFMLQTLAFADTPDEQSYEGGTIPMLYLTFADDVDPETGAVVLSGDEKIELMNTSFNHEYKATGVTASLIVPESYDNPEDDMWDGVSGYAGEQDLGIEFIRGRGNSTWRVAKKPYKIKFESKANLFGMGKNKHWTLLANYYDKSLAIDRLVGWIGNQMNFDFTPRGVPVDLFMNGTYFGSYLLMEEVSVDSNRLDIDVVDENAADTTSLDITGDYLLGASRKPSALPYEYFFTSRNHAFSWEEPEYEVELNEAQSAQQAYVKAHLDRVEDTIYARGFVSERGDYVWDLIDMESLADYWLIQEFTTNPDAFGTPSTYFYKLRDTVAEDGGVITGKLYWGPLWDFDFVWGALETEGFSNTYVEWVSLLRQDEEFVALLKERWAVLDSILEEATKPGGLIDGYIAELSASWEADFAMWPREDERWSFETCEVALEELRSHIEARRAWINANLDQLQTHYNYLSFVADDKEIDCFIVLAGVESWSVAPDAPMYEDMIFAGWFTEDGMEYSYDTVYNEDKVFYATYVDPSTVEPATDIFFAQNELWISSSRGVIIRCELRPSDALDTRIAWSSSDESVVTVTQEGVVEPVEGCLDGRETAEAVVTARLLGSGVEKSIHVVVYNSMSTEIPEPASITLETAIEMEVGALHQIAYSATPYPNALNSGFDLHFSVADESVATVSDLGVIEALSVGTTEITVTRINTETWDDDVIATVALTVTEPAVEPGGDPQPGNDPVEPEQQGGAQQSGAQQSGAQQSATPAQQKLPATGENTASVAALFAAGIILSCVGAVGHWDRHFVPKMEASA